MSFRPSRSWVPEGEPNLVDPARCMIRRSASWLNSMLVKRLPAKPRAELWELPLQPCSISSTPAVRPMGGYIGCSLELA